MPQTMEKETLMQLPTWLRSLAFAAPAFAGRTRGKPRRARPLRRTPLLLEALEDRMVPSSADILYVGDNASGHAANNTVQSFNASTRASLGTFVSGADSLKGARGLIFDGAGHLLVANQDVGRGKPGEIMKYDAATGAFDGDLVPFQDPHAPFAPRGIVVKDNILYVANLQDTDTTKAGIAPDGEIDRYNATTGAFLGAYSRPAGWIGQFNPRSVVFGPDGKLYVSVFDSSNLSAGYVVKYDVATGAESTFASTGTGAPDMHRPEGLTFGPDGRLYITGFRASASDTDKIVILDPTSGAEVNSIALDAVNQPRAYGQAILFGPGGRLFVPITTTGSPYSGAVRSYDVNDGSFVNFEAPGTLDSAWYLTFGQTDPATLAYMDPAVAAPTPAAISASVSSQAPATAVISAPGAGTDVSTGPTLTSAAPSTLSAAVSAGLLTVWSEDDLTTDWLASALVQ
jgi:hypothetical protein